MTVVLVVAGIVVLYVLLNVLTFVLPRTFVKKRQAAKNAERERFAAEAGWRFDASVPELTTRYPVPPFTEHGDRRVAFGVLSGVQEGVPFTAFDFRMRTGVRTGLLWSEETEVHTVFALRLPVPIPPLRLFAVASQKFADQPAPRTADPEFNKRYLIEDGDPAVVNRLFTPAATRLMVENDIGNLSVRGGELVCTASKVFAKTSAREIAERVRVLAMVVHAITRGGQR
ncbi:hypothetical protein EV193_101132 [Herbihabitans rhizosphaerae]|uniref:Uncharacterized protein n=1 Tax=Herbihabitans rhizosphaerae TaxID=1872711 RepID=A0A4Q7L4Q4_9PSEU|nr:hypothetical protein [Herbihabitans rhizosphaerae]RZS44257.1 hypothetical protein EV193_101132 [Herbihabitans rhizosphaerae]